ncbi:MAG: hypothetical protein QM713_17655 [Arachnia sp.]
MFGLLASGLTGILPQALTLGGLYLFLQSQRSRGGVGRVVTLVVTAWAILLAAWGMSLVMPALLPFTADPVLFWISVLLGLLFLPLAFYNLRLARQYERECLLLDSLVPDQTATAGMPDRIRPFLDIQSEDINLRMRLVEGLMATRQPVEAAVDRAGFSNATHFTSGRTWRSRPELLRHPPVCRVPGRLPGLSQSRPLQL